MIKLKNTPKQLLNNGFVGISFVPQWPDREQSKKASGAKEWLLGLLEKDSYYGEYGGVIFVRVPGIETLVQLKFNDVVDKIYHSPKEWPKEWR